MREVHRRLAAAVVLLALLFATTVHYGALDARHDRTEVDAQRLRDYEANVGEPVFFWGRVVGSDGETLQVRAASRTFGVRTDRDPPPGSAVQVYGRLEPGREVTPERLVVSRPDALGRMYGVSVVGLLLAAAGFLRAWRVDLDRLAFVPREEDDA